MSQDEVIKERVLCNLHDDIWDEDLVGGGFYPIYLKVLTKRERLVVDQKVEGVDDEEICTLLGISSHTLKRCKYNIEYKYRNGSKLRVDNYLEIQKMSLFTRDLHDLLCRVSEGANIASVADEALEILQRTFNLGVGFGRKFRARGKR